MRQFLDHSVYIFDCDGVILDSNKTKIKAMGHALNAQKEILSGINESIRYFASNFGKSRFHHVDIFLSKYLVIRSGSSKALLKENILSAFSDSLDKLYPCCPLITGIDLFLESLSGRAYVASGSEEKQLRKVLEQKKLSKYFVDIFGSPSKKPDIVNRIIKAESGSENFILIGDSVADLEAAELNGIEFLGLGEKSNTPELLKKLCGERGYQYRDNWGAVI